MERQEESAPGPVTVRVRQITEEADGVLSFVLIDPTGLELPEWAPGAHVDLVLPSGTVRQYSLCGDPRDRSRYRLAVRLNLPGRGGSEEAHLLRPGALVQLSAVRNTFPLTPAASYLFVAAGIGITPILSMAGSARRQGIPSHLIYIGRNEDALPFLSEIAEAGIEMTVVATSVEGRPSWEKMLAGRQIEAIYCCGPNALMRELESHLERDGNGAELRVERFSAEPLGEGEPTGASLPGDCDQIVCARSGLTTQAPPQKTYLEAIRELGIHLDSSCEMGICGTCQITVLSGEPDHRDSILTQSERDQGAFLPCVSRSRSEAIVLDI